jgi:SAM-dependent methyltransferase
VTPDARGRRPRYDFGLYHWRRRGRRVALAVAAAVVALALRRAGRRSDGRGSRARRAVADVILVWGLYAAVAAVRSLFDPFPWRVRAEKYRRLAAHLPTGNADRLLDVGSGTGRSLVGLAPALGDVSVVALDVFDDRVILGNAPGLARRNAAAAGLDCDVVRGDAATLPFADGSVDVVTACRVLHDLPATAAERTLAEAYRVCEPGGTVGVLELPLPHDAGADPVDYWRGLVSDAGFDVTTVETFERRGREYVVVVGDARA